jgi:hypothetical protein
MAIHRIFPKLRILLGIVFAAAFIKMAPLDAAARPVLDREVVLEIIEEVMAYLQFDASHKQSLFEGEILFTGMPEMEVIDEAVLKDLIGEWIGLKITCLTEFRERGSAHRERRTSGSLDHWYRVFSRRGAEAEQPDGHPAPNFPE